MPSPRKKKTGRTFYEAELTVNGHSKDVLMDKNGVVVEEVEWISIESLLPAVREVFGPRLVARS